MLDRTTMRRHRGGARAATALLGALSVLGAGGCVGTAPREPTIPSTNFSPKLILEVHDDRLAFVRGPREDPAVTVDPASVPGGSVLEVANLGRRDHRLQAGAALDTGTLRPDERQTVVLVNDTAENKVIEITDALDGGRSAKATVTVTPRVR